MPHKAQAQEQDVEISASLEAHKSFLESAVWDDYREYFNGRIKECASLLRTTTDHAQMLRLQGRMDELEFFIEFPERWVADMEFEEVRQAEKEAHNG